MNCSGVVAKFMTMRSGTDGDDFVLLVSPILNVN
jgi:hypothetical protein